jgi:hypothetical protein
VRNRFSALPLLVSFALLCLLPGCQRATHGGDSSLCSGWKQDQVETHRVALGRLGPLLKAEVEAKTFTTGPMTVFKFAVDDFRREYGACSEAGGYVAAGFELRNDAVVFTSWSQLARFVDDRSRAAQAEAERRTTKAPSPDGFRVASVGGDPYRTAYCLLHVDGRCSSWNLIAISPGCRSILVDLQLDGRAYVDDQEGALRLLTHVADLWLGSLDEDLRDVPCARYTGEAHPVTWFP